MRLSELVTKDGYSLDTDRQAKLVRPLYMGLLTPEQETFARKRLIAALDHYGWRLGTGFLSTPMILDVLAGLDISYAYRLLENEEMPGWLFMPKSGATTIWEAWEGNQKDQMDRLAEPLFQRRGLRVADEHDVRHPDHRRKPCYNCTEARRGHHLRTG